MVPSDREDLIWLSGLLEGEGCFTLANYGSGKGSSYLSAVIHLAMSDEDIVARVKSIAGGSYWAQKKGEHKVSYRWSLQCGKAVELMEALLPLMGKRRQERIREVLSTHRLERERGRLAQAERGRDGSKQYWAVRRHTE